MLNKAKYILLIAILFCQNRMGYSQDAIKQLSCLKGLVLQDSGIFQTDAQVSSRFLFVSNKSINKLLSEVKSDLHKAPVALAKDKSQPVVYDFDVNLTPEVRVRIVVFQDIMAHDTFEKSTFLAPKTKKLQTKLILTIITKRTTQH